MSTSSFTGTIKNFSPKPDEDYYGIFIDNGKEEKWLNGHGSPNDNWSKGDKVKIKANMDEFIEIEEIDVISGDEKAGSESASTSAPNGSEGGQSSSAYISADETSAVIRAAETVRDLHPELKEGEHIQKVSEYAEGYHNKMKDLGDE